MKEEQAAVQNANYIAEDIGTKAYYALLEEVYTRQNQGLWICIPAVHIRI